MRTSVRVAWRVLAAVAFAGTAALAVTLTRGAPAHVSLISAQNAGPTGRHAAAGVPRCAPAGLDISIASRTAARISSHSATFHVDFTNISGAACTLIGYPEVSAYLAGGAQVGNAAVLDRSVSASRIMLAPGATAHAAVVESVPPGRCSPVAATGLRVVLPGQDVPRYVRHPIVACSAAGHKAPVFLRVQAVQPGAGAIGAPREHSEQASATR
jgi:Domain of unknown function (DUF4232)